MSPGRIFSGLKLGRYASQVYCKCYIFIVTCVWKDRDAVQTLRKSTTVYQVGCSG